MQIQLTLLAEKIIRHVFRNYEGDEAIISEDIHSQKTTDISIDFLSQEAHNLIKQALDLIDVDKNHQEHVIRSLMHHGGSPSFENNKEEEDDFKKDVPVFRITDIRNCFHDERQVLQQSIMEAEEEECERTPASLRAIRSLKTKRISVEEGGDATKCMICLEEFCKGEKVTCMPCPHMFHGDCITKWLLQSHVCPVCRYQMPKAYKG